MLKEGLTPLLDALFVKPPSQEQGRDFREGRSPSLTYTPPSLIKGRGQGDRLLNDLI